MDVKEIENLLTFNSQEIDRAFIRLKISLQHFNNPPLKPKTPDGWVIQWERLVKNSESLAIDKINVLNFDDYYSNAVPLSDRPIQSIAEGPYFPVAIKHRKCEVVPLLPEELNWCKQKYIYDLWLKSVLKDTELGKILAEPNDHGHHILTDDKHFRLIYLVKCNNVIRRKMFSYALNKTLNWLKEKDIPFTIKSYTLVD